MQPRKRPHPNRQPRSNNNNSTNSTSNTNTSHRRNPKPPYPSSSSIVPHYSTLTPGTGVSIVLKADQPTGNEVTGIVADLLTRGDHPRGVKVRLRDGRVGRVQRLVSTDEGDRGEAAVGGAGAGLGRDGEGIGTRGGSGFRRGERDIREEDEYFYDERGRSGDVDHGYFAALEEADRRHAESKGLGRGGKGDEEVVKCPVCGEFEGDERAVAFHVEGHFAE